MIKASRCYLVTDVLQQISAEEHLPVDYIKQRLAVLDDELNRLEQEGCHLEDRIRSCLYFEMSVNSCNQSDWSVVIALDITSVFLHRFYDKLFSIFITLLH